MKTLYFECNMGAAGDMLTAALLELSDDRQAFLRKMNSLALPGVIVSAEQSTKCGITGTHMKVTVNGEEEESSDETMHHDELHTHSHSHEHMHDHQEDSNHDHGHSHDHGHHHHTSLSDIEHLIDTLDVSDKVKSDVKSVYAIIADAESKVHGHPVAEIHFHEVGAMDAVADVLGVCLLMEELAPDQVLASPVHTGSGSVRCAHGVLPVPAPATALILQGIPSYSGRVKGELCTPTGAALLKHFVSRFGDRPVMTTDAIGYGMGKKDFDQANCVRAFLGESGGQSESAVKLECNLDDMTGEDIGYATEQLFAAGALDVYTQAIGMKKSRPGILLSVICHTDDADRLASVMMKHTSTLGIRRHDLSRYVLKREINTVETAFGKVRVKRASGMGVEKSKPEYEDLASIASEKDLPLRTIRNELSDKL